MWNFNARNIPAKGDEIHRSQLKMHVFERGVFQQQLYLTGLSLIFVRGRSRKICFRASTSQYMHHGSSLANLF